MTEYTQALTHKLGPLPAWAWGLGLGGVIIGVRKVMAGRSAPASATPPAEAGTAVTTQADGTPTMAQPVGSSTGWQWQPAGSSSGTYDPASTYPDDTGTTSTKVETNDQWRRAAERWALDNTQYPPTAILGAIGRYLEGSPLQADQATIVNGAIRGIGTPPQGAPPVVVLDVSTPAPATTPAPSTPTTFTPPSWLPAGTKFIKGSGPAIYQVTSAGIEWVPSEDAFRALGGQFGPTKNYVEVPDSVLRNLPRVGTLPDRAADPSLP